MLYQVLFTVGGLGLLVQAVLGSAHHDGDATSDSGHSGHSDHSLPDDGGHFWLLFLSPLRLFGFSLGMGGAGLALESALKLPPVLVFGLALLAGWLFYRAVIKPLMALVLHFASKPATMLSGAVGQEATADSRFDATGRGIITLVVDGHLVRLLATLEGSPEAVEAGEKLVVIAIDMRRNTATVAKL
ncbi:hypothetical protein [Armatimonas rosea]|uniref:NfeD-like C-terminal domain-containing protein n=1 Tax=Armatimonas rosea TaxID=685828 RepID=A0A7W9SKH0_ARMRO|nr:hypothetical protein [Armatimonas rosea]MBB6048260.1 hypothetical protein [Armatimonas rosea]